MVGSMFRHVGIRLVLMRWGKNTLKLACGLK